MTTYSVQFNPSSEVLLAAVALGDQLLIIEPPFATPSQKINAEKLFATESDNNANETIKALVSWQKPPAADEANGIRLRIQYHRGDKASLKSVVWHYRGDYVATVCPDASHNAVLIHQLTKRMTQSPFKKTYGNRINVLQPFSLIMMVPAGKPRCSASSSTRPSPSSLRPSKERYASTT